MKNLKTAVGATLFAVGMGAATATGVQAQADKSSMARAITLTGIVGGAPMAKEFFMRANGETYRVQPLAKVGMSGIRGGDRVRVFGRPTGLIISYANVRVLSSRASDNPSDYNTPNQTTTVQSQPSRRTGGPARSTTIQTPPQVANQGMAMQNGANRPAINRSNAIGGRAGFVSPGVTIGGVGAPGVVSSGVIGSTVVVPNVVTPGGVVVPNVTTANAIRNGTVKPNQPR